MERNSINKSNQSKKLMSLEETHVGLGRLLLVAPLKWPKMENDDHDASTQLDAKLSSSMPLLSVLSTFHKMRTPGKTRVPRRRTFAISGKKRKIILILPRQISVQCNLNVRRGIFGKLEVRKSVQNGHICVLNKRLRLFSSTEKNVTEFEGKWRKNLKTRSFSKTKKIKTMVCKYGHHARWGHRALTQNTCCLCWWPGIWSTKND